MTRPDNTSRTEDQAGQADRLTAPDYRDTERDEPGVSTELTHAHGPGLICLSCALAKSRAKFAEAEAAELLVCDGCDGLYDHGCTHGYWLCFECTDRCAECRDEAAGDADADRPEWRGGAS